MTYPPLGPASSGEQWPDQPPQPWPTNQPGPGGPPPRRNKWLYVSLTLAAVVILVLSGVVIGQMTGGDSDAPTPTAAPQSSTAQSSSSAPRPTQQPSAAAGPSTTCEGYTVQLDATSPPGWQPTIGKRGLAYAAPPEWSVKDCGVQLGWQKPCPDGQPGLCAIRAMSAASDLPSPACEKATVAMAGVAGSKKADIRAALDDEMRSVPLIYSSESGQTFPATFTPVREFMIGSAPAVQRVGTITGITGVCTGSTALHSMVVTTVPNVEGSVVFIISLRQDTPGAPNPDVINEMVATLRGAG